MPGTSDNDQQNSINQALIIGPAPAGDEAAAEFQQQHPHTQITRIDTPEQALAKLADLPRFDLAMLVDTLEVLDKSAAEHLLASLRDLHCKCLIAVVRLGDDWQGLSSHWHANDLLAFGMKRLALYQQDDKPVGVYEFKLHDYKLKPDWLNAKHWAHPERWDQH